MLFLPVTFQCFQVAIWHTQIIETRHSAPWCRAKPSADWTWRDFAGAAVVSSAWRVKGLSIVEPSQSEKLDISPSPPRIRL
jgi:hypothetical protein